MDRVKIGNTFRAIRVELRMRQADVAERANVSQQRISDIECGRLGGISIETYCRVAGAIDADVQLTPRWRGPKLDRLLDRRHALLQNRVVEILAAAGWIVRTEFSFNLFGDRGSVDILAWMPAARGLLVVEIKTEITGLEETLRVLDMKRRVVPALVAREVGWRAAVVASVLVMPDASTHRDLIDRHSAMVSASLPGRTVAVRNWVTAPAGQLSGIWFLRDTRQGGAKWRVLSSRRIRRRRAEAGRRPPQPDHAQEGSQPRPTVPIDSLRDAQQSSNGRQRGPSAT
jgi:transcriptional regulator with XRE-family HTH domain